MKSRVFRRCGKFFSVLFSIVTATLVAMPLHGQASEKLFFASDVHCNYSNLSGLLTDCGNPYEVVGLVGDHGATGGGGDITESGEYSTIISTINAVDSGAVKILSQGNHETDAGETGLGVIYSHSTGEAILSGNEYYEVYVINWDDFFNYDSSTNPGLIDDLEAYLNSRTGEKVVFVMCHAPLHSTRNDINQDAAEDVFDTLQLYGEKLDIVFLWGHTHHAGLDDNVNYLALPEGTINTAASTGSNLISSVANATLTFIYLNAGYVNEANSGTVVSVDDREINIHGCGGHSTWDETVERKSPGVVLLFDTSGSMSWDVNDTIFVAEEDQRLTLAKHAAEAFVEMLDNYEGTGSVGVATFPNHPQDGCDAEVLRRFSTVPDDDSETELMGIIDGLIAGGSTPMKAGLDLASAIITSGSPKAIVLLTDGYHNCPGIIGYGSSEYNDMISELNGIKVYPIGFARPADTDRNFLQGLADGDPADLSGASSGEFSDVTFDPSIYNFDPGNPDLWTTEIAKAALTSVYSNIMTDVLGLTKIVDPIGAVGSGETNTHDIAISRVDDKITFLLSWHTPSDKRLSFQVRSSDNQIVPVSARGVKYQHGSTYKIFFVEGSFLKMPGKVGSTPWKLEVTGDGVGSGETEKYQYSVISDSSLKMTASLDKKRYGTGDVVTLSAKLTLGGEAMPGLENVSVDVDAPSDGAGNWFAENKVSAKQLAIIDKQKGDETLADIQRKATYLLDRAKVEFPGPGEPVTLPLYDDGTHGDFAAGDGIYTNQYSGTVKEGTYSFAFKASGSVYDGDSFSREKIVQKYIIVNTSPDAITLDMAVSGVVDGGNQYLLTVTPKDVYGNFLGPRFANSIDIVLSAGSLIGELTDNIDGTYSQLISLPESVSWQDVAATVDVNGVTAALPLPEPTTEHGMGWVLWLLIILLIICAIAIFIILR